MHVVVTSVSSAVLEFISDSISAGVAPGDIYTSSSTVQTNSRSADLRSSSGLGAVGSNGRPGSDRASSSAYSEANGRTTVGSGSSDVVKLVAMGTNGSIVKGNSLVALVTAAVFKLVSEGLSRGGAPGNVNTSSS